MNSKFLYLSIILLIPVYACKDACEKVCVEEAAFLEEEECLKEWDITWNDLGFVDSDDFVSECIDSWGDFQKMNSQNKIEEQLDWCEDYLRELSEFDECDDLLEWWEYYYD